MPRRVKTFSITGQANIEVITDAIISTTTEPKRVIGVTVNPTGNEDDYLVCKIGETTIVKEYHANLDDNSHFLEIDEVLTGADYFKVGNHSGATKRDMVIGVYYEII